MNRKRKQICLEQKLEILKRFKSGEKAVEIAKNLDLAPTTVRTICNRDADQIREFAKTATLLQSKQVTKIRSPTIVKMESLLSFWIENQNQRRMPLSKMIIQNKAISLFNEIQKNSASSSSENLEKFEASQSWFERFKTRANLHNVVLKGESASADVPAANKFKVDLKAIVNEGGYSPKQVLNVDELGLLWKRLPSRTYISKSEKSCPGYKTSKERLTLLLEGNAEGNFKFKPFLVYYSANPRAFKNVNKNELPVHWRTNKKAWMTAILFKDWFENCAVSELKKYCRTENIEFKMLLLLDNAPGHPIYLDDISENIKVISMPPNTTTLIQPMDQGAISTFKSYYLRRTFGQLIAATDGEDKPSMKQFWKNYNILKAVENISSSWKEVKKSCMNGVWRQLWPECVCKNTEEVDTVSIVRREIAELAREANFEGMEENDIDELLMLHDQEFQNEDLFAMDIDHMLEDNADTPVVVPEEKMLTSRHISEAMLLISKAMDIFSENDPDENRSSKVTRAVADATNCYKEIYLEKKSLSIQQTLDNFLMKLPQQPNQPTEMTIDIESSSSE